MSDKYLYFTLHIAFAYLDTFWSAYEQEKRHPTKIILDYACDYRRLSLSQSPGDQTKYLEISVV